MEVIFVYPVHIEIKMVERAPIRNAYLFSSIFETMEEALRNPFEFQSDGLVEGDEPAKEIRATMSGYLLQLEVI